MDRRFVKDFVKVIVAVVVGGIIIGSLALVFRIEQPSYITNAEHPCVIAPVTIPPNPQ